MELLVSEISRYCENCRNTRKPFYKYVTEGKQSYIIFQCRICNLHDIEPITVTKDISKKVRKDD